MAKKNRTNNILPFPAATRSVEEKAFPPSTVFFQIGSDRFAFHMQCEWLPPAPRLLSQVRAAEGPPSPLPTRRRRGSPARLKRTRNLNTDERRNSKPSLVPDVIRSSRTGKISAPLARRNEPPRRLAVRVGGATEDAQSPFLTGDRRGPVAQQKTGRNSNMDERRSGKPKVKAVPD